MTSWKRLSHPRGILRRLPRTARPPFIPFIAKRAPWSGRTPWGTAGPPRCGETSASWGDPPRPPPGPTRPLGRSVRQPPAPPAAGVHSARSRPREAASAQGRRGRGCGGCARRPPGRRRRRGAGGAPRPLQTGPSEAPPSPGRRSRHPPSPARPRGPRQLGDGPAPPAPERTAPPSVCRRAASGAAGRVAGQQPREPPGRAERAAHCRRGLRPRGAEHQRRPPAPAPRIPRERPYRKLRGFSGSGRGVPGSRRCCGRKRRGEGERGGRPCALTAPSVPCAPPHSLPGGPSGAAGGPGATRRPRDSGCWEGCRGSSHFRGRGQPAGRRGRDQPSGGLRGSSPGGPCPRSGWAAVRAPQLPRRRTWT